MIVDANVAVYWSVETPFARASMRVLAHPDLIAPRLLLIEVADALTKYKRIGQIDIRGVREGVDLARRSIAEFVDDVRLLESALNLAIMENHRVYDCLYLALALERREPLATADKRLAALAQKLGVETTLVEPE